MEHQTKVNVQTYEGAIRSNLFRLKLGDVYRVERRFVHNSDLPIFIIIPKDYDIEK